MVDTAMMSYNAQVKRPWHGCQVKRLCPPVIAACRGRKTEQVGVQLLLDDPAQELDFEDCSIVAEKTAWRQRAPVRSEEGVGLGRVGESSIAGKSQTEERKAGKELDVSIAYVGNVADVG